MEEGFADTRSRALAPDGEAQSSSGEKAARSQDAVEEGGGGTNS